MWMLSSNLPHKYVLARVAQPERGAGGINKSCLLPIGAAFLTRQRQDDNAASLPIVRNVAGEMTTTLLWLSGAHTLVLWSFFVLPRVFLCSFGNHEYTPQRLPNVSTHTRC